MKKRFKAIVAVVMCAAMLFTTGIGASAATATDETQSTDSSFAVTIANTVSNVLNKVVDTLLDLISGVLPSTVKVQAPSAHSSENFYEGNEEFIDEAAAGAQWSLGYASASIIPSDFHEGKYYKGGYDINLQLDECIDDLKVRVIVIDDNSGRGKSVFAVVDCLGLANADVRNIRAALADFAEENNIISINVSATHVHSGIDTQGIYTDTFGHVFQNLFAAIAGSDNLCDPVDTTLLNTITAQTVECVKEAVATMEEGTLTYAKTDISDYVRDRTNPKIMINDMYRLMFTPDNDDAKGTIISNYGVHPEAIGYGTQLITSDFIHYTEEVINAAGYNYMFIQGAVGTYTESQGLSGDGLGLDRVNSTIRYGQEIGYILLGMTETEEYCIENIVDAEREAAAAESEDYTPWYEGWVPAEEKVVEPILNIRISEYLAPVENGVYKAFGKLSLANNVMYKDADGNVTASTEVGYMELGKDIKIILCPGETYAELIVGGENMADFEYACAYDIMADEDDEILVFDLMNDALGYIMPDNDFVYLRLNYDDDGFSFGDSWGLTSIGEHAASDIYGAIYDVYESVR